MAITAEREAVEEPPSLQAVVEKNVADFLQLTPELLRAIGVSPDVTLASPTEEQAHIVRLQRLFSDPSIRAALRTIRFTPQAWRQIETMLGRSDELREAASVPGDLVRALTPLLSAIFTTPRAYAIWTVALQRAVMRESNEIARRIDSGRNYSHDLIVGSGWHGEVLATTLLARNPDSDVVCVDDAKHIGGQFEASTGEVHLLNSRTRPERADLPNIPGREGSLNPMGLAPLQQSDVETLSYGTQARFGNLIATNHWFAAPTVVMRDILWARRSLTNPDQYEVTARDKETGKRVTTVHDRITFTTGLGSCNVDLPGSNDATTRLIAREQEKPLAERRITTYPDEITRLGDPDNQFPLQGRKQVAVVGPGDGGRIIVGKYTGHETGNKQSVPSLDWPLIRWYGQPAATFKEFAARERARYVADGLEMPRTEVDQRYYFRVQPNPRKAVDIAEGIDSDGCPTGKLVVIDEAGKKYTCDHVVLAPGFTDRTMEALSTLNPDVYSDSREVPNDDLCKAGVRVLGDFGVIEVDEVIEPANGTPFQYEIYRVGKDGSQSVARVGRETLLALVDANREAVTRVEVPRDAELTEVFIDGASIPAPRVFRDPEFITREFERLRGIQGTRFFARDGVEIDKKLLDAALRQGRIAAAEVPANRTAAISSLGRRDPIARVVEGTEVYLAGPVSALPVTDNEKRRTEAFNRLPSNSQAGFRYVERVEALGGRFARDDSLNDRQPTNVGEEIRDSSTAYVADPEVPRVCSELRRMTVPSVEGDDSCEDIVVCADRGADDFPQVPDGALYEDMVRLAACEADELSPLGLVAEDPDATVRIDIARASGDGSSKQWTARVAGIEPSRVSEIADLFADPLVIEVADRYIDGPGSRATVALPVVAGKLDVEGVAIRTQKGVSL